MRRKFLNSFLCILLTFITATSFACTGGSGAGIIGGGQEEDIIPTKYSELPDYKDGIHLFNKTATNGSFIKNKQTDYVIVIPNENNATDYNAAMELVSLLQEAVGINMNLYYESNLPAGSKYISIGNTELSAGIVVDERINSNGYIIKTSGQNIYIKSKGTIGVLWGVYEFLTQTVGYNFVAYDEWSFESNIVDVPLYDFNIIDSPDFESRIANNGCVYNVANLAHKYRWQLPHSEIYMNDAEIPAYHNFFEYVPKATYEKSHGKWYSLDGTQLCFTTRGDKNEYDALVNVVAERMKLLIQSDKNDRKILTFTQEDMGGWCKCTHCKQVENKYKAKSAVVIKFLNDVIPIVEEWREENYPNKDVVYATFAYDTTLDAPAKKNDDGSFSPIDQEVICHPKMAIMIAPYHMDCCFGIDQPENNLYYDSWMAWSSICKTLGYWGYSTYYSHMNVMYNSFTTAQSIYKFLANQTNTIWIFDQGQHDIPNHTSFTYFKMYLQSQWQWDVNRDYRILKENFFDSFYREAAEPMKKFYDEYSTQMYNINKNLQQGKKVDSKIDINDTTFPFQMLQQWLGYIEQAKDAVKKYETENPSLYKKLIDRITIESISPRYIIWKCHENKFSTNDWKIFVESYNHDADMYGINIDIRPGY